MNVLVKLFIGFCAVVVIVKSQSTCKTPVRENGECVPIRSCTLHMDLLQNAPKPLSKRILEYVKNSYCGIKGQMHQVCCAARHRVQDPSVNIVEIVMEDPEPNPVEIVMEDPKPNPVEIVMENPKPDINTNQIILNRYEDSEDVSNHPNLKLVNANYCGQIADDKLSNGNDTALGEFPWLVLLQFETAQGLAFKCGGALISSRYVLTAAHCVGGVSEPLVAVRVGEYDTSEEIDCDFDSCLPAAKDIPIEEVIKHPGFQRFSDDIALIRLKQEVDFSNGTVLPICLPTKKSIQTTPIKRMTISGWGRTENQTSANILQKATLPVLPNDDCQRAFGAAVMLTSRHMCAGGESGVDSCHGDSGGPLFATSAVNGIRYVQYGIISGGIRECGFSTTYPGVYTRVTSYMKWILDKMRP